MDKKKSIFLFLFLFVSFLSVDTKTVIVVLYYRLLFSQAWEVTDFISLNDGYV